MNTYIELSLYGVKDTKERWELEYNDGNGTKIMASGDGWDLGDTIAENYVAKYQPDDYYRTTPDIRDNVNDLKKIEEYYSEQSS